MDKHDNSRVQQALYVLRRCAFCLYASQEKGSQKNALPRTEFELTGASSEIWNLSDPVVTAAAGSNVGARARAQIRRPCLMFISD